MEKRRGAVLILVLVLVAALTLVVVAALRAIRVDDASARSYRRGLAAMALAESGLRLAAVSLARDQRAASGDHPGEPWAWLFPAPGQAGARLPVLPGRLPEPDNPTDPEELFGEIVDESGKFPLKGLVARTGSDEYRGVFVRLLSGPPFNRTQDEAEALADALADWMDPDAEARRPDGSMTDTGAEDPFYASLHTVYKGRDGPPDTLAELALVKGFGRELLDGRDGGTGLGDLVSIWGDGKININTAPPEILRALPKNRGQAGSEAFAADVAAFRADERNAARLETDGWLKTELPQWRDLELPESVLTTKSTTFTVRLTARSGDVTRRLYACLKRGYGQAASSGQTALAGRSDQTDKAGQADKAGQSGQSEQTGQSGRTDQASPPGQSGQTGFEARVIYRRYE